MDELSEEDKLTVARARKIQRFLSAAVPRGRSLHRHPGQVRPARRHREVVQGGGRRRIRSPAREPRSTWSAASTKRSRRPRSWPRRNAVRNAMALHFELVTPAKLVRSEDVHMVVVPGTEGDFGVLEGHAPVMWTIRDAALRIYRTEGAQPEDIQVRGRLCRSWRCRTDRSGRARRRLIQAGSIGDRFCRFAIFLPSLSPPPDPKTGPMPCQHSLPVSFG